MTLEERLAVIRQQFGQKGIRVDSDWLSGCVQFFIDENSSITSTQLYQQAEEQWELSDLCDSGVKCLKQPETITTKKESHVVNGTFPLQIIQLIDISESPYNQLQQIQNKEVEMGKEEPEFKQTYQKTQKKRMFKLELTDGFKNVSALEYTPIPCLTTKLVPGIKVVVFGPLRCVNHILFLEAKNIRILGGEVTTLIPENVYENVLRKKLNQPINPNPKCDYQEPIVNADVSVVWKANDVPSIPMSANKAIQSNVISSASQFNPVDDFMDDDFLTEIDIDQITSKASNTQTRSEASTSRQQTRIPANQQSTQLFDDMDDMAFLNIDSTIEHIISEPKNDQKSRGIEFVRNETSGNIASNQVQASICDDKYLFKIHCEATQRVFSK